MHLFYNLRSYIYIRIKKEASMRINLYLLRIYNNVFNMNHVNVIILLYEDLL